MKLFRYTLAIFIVLGFMASCSNTDKSGNSETQTAGVIPKDTTVKGAMRYVDLEDPLEEDLIARGSEIFELRCSACHELSDEKLVAPGWEGLTNRRSPEWIMNMIMNVNIMLEFDSAAHQLLEENETVMPEQYLAVDDARSVLEFIRNNDLERLGTKDQGRASAD